MNEKKNFERERMRDEKGNVEKKQMRDDKKSRARARAKAKTRTSKTEEHMRIVDDTRIDTRGEVNTETSI
jgi:hypothetical protein